MEKKERDNRRGRRAMLKRAQADFRRIVAMIIERYAPRRIYQWGSLVTESHFSERSDIDIAPEGVTDPELFFELIKEAEKLSDLPVHVVQIEHIHPAYAQGIKTRGRVVHERGARDSS